MRLYTASAFIGVCLTAACLVSCAPNSNSQNSAMPPVRTQSAPGRHERIFTTQPTVPCDTGFGPCFDPPSGPLTVSIGGSGWSPSASPSDPAPDPFAGGVQRTTRDITIRSYYLAGEFFVECDVYSAVVSAKVFISGRSGDPSETVHPMVAIVAPGIAATFKYVTTSPIGNSIAVRYSSSGPQAIPPAICTGSN